LETAKEPAVVPFYAARISDLGRSDFVQAECICGHTERLTAAMLTTAGVKPGQRLEAQGFVSRVPQLGRGTRDREAAPPQLS